MKKNTVVKRFCIYITIGLLLGCTNENQQAPEQSINQFYNFMILVDLSDRIDNIAQSGRDIRLIELLLESFAKKQSRTGYKSFDEISVSFLNQKGSTIKMDDIAPDLEIKMDFTFNRDKFERKRKQFGLAVKELYNRAAESPKTGSDLWSFFRDKMQTRIKPPDEKRNIIFLNKCFVLTDGYLQFNSGTVRRKGTYMPNRHLKSMRKSQDWKRLYFNKDYGLTPHSEVNFRNLEVILLEIDPENPIENQFEFPMLQHYWTDWFNKMGIEAEIYQRENSPKSLESRILKFLKKNT